jgi:hypothetical protein
MMLFSEESISIKVVVLLHHQTPYTIRLQPQVWSHVTVHIDWHAAADESRETDADMKDAKQMML